MAENNNNNNNNSNIIELLSDSDDDEKKPAAVDNSTSAKPQPRANMLCQFFKRNDCVSTTVVAKPRKQPTPKKRAKMNGISDNVPNPEPVILYRYPIPEPDLGKDGFDLELTGPPEAWSRPSFMAWFGEDGRLLRRVVNTNRQKQDHLRRMVTGMLMENYSVNPADHPIFKKGVPVAVELEFHRRPPNDDFIANNRQNYFKDRIMKVIFGGFKLMFDTKRPDADNLQKFVLDALEGIAYEDDAQVVSIAVKKVLDTNPPCEGRTYICFRKANDKDAMPIISRERKQLTKAATPGTPIKFATL